MHHMDSNKTHRENAGWEIHKNAPGYFEQFLEVTPHETAVLWPSIPVWKASMLNKQDMKDTAGESRMNK